MTNIETLRPGVTRLECPMPRFASVNAWLIGDKSDQIILDTGMPGEPTRQVWVQAAELGHIGNVTDIVCTHMHRDHTGQASPLMLQYGAALNMSALEHQHITWASSTSLERRNASAQNFLHMMGMDEPTRIKSKPIDYAMLSPFPQNFNVLTDRQTLELAGRSWSVIIGGGHSSAGVSLLAEDNLIFLSGDQMLAGAGPHITVWSETPDADPLGAYFDYLDRLMPVPESCLVLPGHGSAFTGLAQQAQKLRMAHERRLQALLEHLSQAATIQTMSETIFSPRAASRFSDLVPGMTLSLANYLWHRGKLTRRFSDDGVMLFERA
ncbi:MBL fold metallo-hydrolase [Devosia sp. MC521]|uniref:MBL fold metallo-hydrolase n=1 Tax=Devosia sp. MC521 TaxID=2759954 RepID=UPI0015FE1653|nr:MBL fold metallo-hydrolase [Devosia sp. MC521]MBJ6989124.1 MBL fold metallo-hydrolase [Devosia sp. MC521]QMW63323.1 MBL fold metallo-hydrolase [Devosia sp. MC521]